MKPEMNLPISIDNDGLTDAVAALVYKSEYNREFLEEKLLDFLNKRYDLKFRFLPAPKNDVNMKANITRFIANRVFRIQFSETMIMTNIVGRYPGWKCYSDLLSNILEVLGKVAYKEAYVRYVSLFDNISIFDQVEGEGLRITTLPDFQGTEFNFRCKIKGENNLQGVATIRLTNNKNLPDRIASVVDIMVNAKLPDESPKTAMDYLQFLHFHEKHLFFLMMKKDFIDQHNPIYE